MSYIVLNTDSIAKASRNFYNKYETEQAAN